MATVVSVPRDDLERLRHPGDRVPCLLCGRSVEVVPPPEDRSHDPWPGSDVPRLARHGAT